MGKPKVLYVDDISVNLMIFEKIFVNEFDIVLASSGEKAVLMLKSDPDIEIVVSDWQMPQMDGLELISYVHKIYPEKICFLLSGCNNPPVVNPYLERGMIKNYFIKPINKSFILEKIRKAYNGKRREGPNVI